MLHYYFLFYTIPIFIPIKRSKDHHIEWEFEDDMLADFGKYF
jgi:hypothetical protein